jgi:hypothetical protein
MIQIRYNNERINPFIIIIVLFGISWFGLYAKYFENIQISNRIVLSVIALLTQTE